MDTATGNRRRSTASSVATPARDGRPRRVRPSRARGLRTSTGCLTCRRRRIKCDEGKPRCAQCCKSDRDCQYAQAQDGEQESQSRHRSASTVSNPGEDAQHERTSVDISEPEGLGADVVSASSPVAEDTSITAQPTEFARSFVPPFNQTGQSRPLGVEDGLQPSVADADLGFSPLALSQTSLLNISPFEWYDLLAQDAINNLQRLNSLPNGEVRWVFDESTLSRRQTPLPESPNENGNDGDPSTFGHHDLSVTPPWNTTANIELSSNELVYLRYYADVIGPILDLFDPDRHFTNVVPHLAVRNIGLLKSVLAVAARHKSLGSHPGHSSWSQPSSSDSNGDNLVDEESARVATQYYYETLQYLSHTLLYPSYANSHEILATSIMISTYEMFDLNSSSNNGDWERHLRGSFWIQRSQDNNAESSDSFRRAVWWQWIRQDIWAAFRSGRRTLTIFQPQKTLHELSPDDLASRILFLAAKCVAYAAHDATSSIHDLQRRMNLGNRLLRSLEEWRESQPSSFLPIYGGGDLELASGGSQPTCSSSSPSLHQHGQPSTGAATGSPPSAKVFEPIWVHPPRNAGALQMYHFARSIVLLAQPSTGGLNIYRRRQRLLNESLRNVCGIAEACQQNDCAMAFLNVQVIFAVGQCAQNEEKQAALLKLLKNSVAASNFPSKGLSEELGRIWKEGF